MPLNLLLVLQALCAVGHALQPQIPSVQFWSPGAGAGFHLSPLVRIIVDRATAHQGHPSLLEFATTFREDLNAVTGWSVAKVQLAAAPSLAKVPSVFLSLGATSNFTYLSGKEAEDGYEFEVSPNAYVVRAKAPIGAWWATRTLLQQVVLSQNSHSPTTIVSIPAGNGTDVPGWEVRGAMLDVGRHYFTTGFLAELCTYASFFKISSLHLHASDNLWDKRFLYGQDWRLLYSGFRFRPGAGSENEGLVPPAARNQSWSHDEFSRLQTSCAARGVKLVPEIDAPGHSLVFTKWKPQIAMSGAPDNLNLSHPDTIPTLKGVWREFLPWFSGSDEVHIGADEYDRNFANGVRVWGTGMPAASDGSTISTDVTIQHWNFPDTIPVQLLDQGYRVINSEQAFLYTDGKTSYDYGSQFPTELKPDLFWPTDATKPAWQPNVFSFDDASNNTDPAHPGLRGAVMALWNDWGNNATTPLEIFQQLSRSLAMLGERTWAGAEHLDRPTFERVYTTLNKKAPGQNLDRRDTVHPGRVVFRYPGPVREDFATHAAASSVGPPYELSFTVTPYAQMGTLFSGPDTRLHLANLTFEDVQTGTFFPLGLDSAKELPLHTATQVTIVADRNSTRATVGGDNIFWETNLSIWGYYMQRANMTFVAPAQRISADGFKGIIKDVKLVAL
ncbi:glycoside hydrolase [Auriculariales sp. MPI-PUGE-AT-0066]|nr:glycoside hydrolase [Auriculariales sp. MPI-PUGE-AT-0066]